MNARHAGQGGRAYEYGKMQGCLESSQAHTAVGNLILKGLA